MAPTRVHTVEYPKASLMLLALPLDTECTVLTFLVVIVSSECVHQHVEAMPK